MLALVCKHLYSGYPTFSEGTWTLQTYITVSNTSPYLRRYDYRSLWIYRVDGTLPSSVVCDDPHHSPIIDASAIFHFKHIYESSWVLWAAAQVVRLLNQFRVELAARLAGPRIPDRSSEVRSCLGWPLTPPNKRTCLLPRHDPWDCHICRSDQGGLGGQWGGIYGSPMECLGFKGSFSVN